MAQPFLGEVKIISFNFPPKGWAFCNGRLTDNANVAIPTNAYLASTNNLYTTAGNLTTTAPDSLTNFGGSQPHSNLQPYLVLNFVIALQGIFPSRN